MTVKMVTEITPNSFVHQWLHHTSFNPDTFTRHKRAPATTQTQRDALAFEDLQYQRFIARSHKRVGFQGGLADFSSKLIYDSEIITFALTDLGRRALAGINCGEVWHIGNRNFNEASTRKVWRKCLSHAILEESDANYITKLPHKYQDIKRELTQYLMLSQRMDVLNRGTRDHWVRLEFLREDGTLPYRHPNPLLCNL